MNTHTTVTGQPPTVVDDCTAEPDAEGAVPFVFRHGFAAPPWTVFQDCPHLECPCDSYGIFAVHEDPDVTCIRGMIAEGLSKDLAEYIVRIANADTPAPPSSPDG